MPDYIIFSTGFSSNVIYAGSDSTSTNSESASSSSSYLVGPHTPRDFSESSDVTQQFWEDIPADGEILDLLPDNKKSDATMLPATELSLNQMVVYDSGTNHHRTYIPNVADLEHEYKF